MTGAIFDIDEFLSKLPEYQNENTGTAYAFPGRIRAPNYVPLSDRRLSVGYLLK